MGMSNISDALPQEFAELEALVPNWTFPTERERRHACAGTPMSEIRAFYALVGPRMEAIAAYLDTFPMGILPKPQNNLLMLAQIYMEVAVCVEFLGAPDMGPEQISPDRWFILDV